jgi:sulfur-oxidizing protein SoxX
MRKRGSRLSRPKSLAEIRRAALAAILVAAASASGEAVAQDSAPLRPYEIEGDGIPRSLTGARGDPARGRALVADRQRGLCLLCHSGPFPEQPFQGDLAPSLAGAGSRLTESQLRLRMVDGSRINPATMMPSYYRIEGLTRVGRAWQGKPVLSAEQIEDVVAFLVTLTDDGTARTPP